MFGASPGGFGAAGGFGQAQPQPAGTSLFGGGVFNTQQASAPTFGSPTPTFGQQVQPTFGAASQPAFGSSTFGQTSLFQQNKPATGFGLSTPTFGQSAGASVFGGGGGTFGQPAAPAAPVFGQSAPAFGGGTSLFGNAAPASTPALGAMSFGQAPAVGVGGGMFGAASPPAAQPIHPQLGYATDGQGSRVTQFQPLVQEQSGATAGTKQVFKSISAMPTYGHKSQEELRLEDYAAGVKGQIGAQPHGGLAVFSPSMNTGFSSAAGGLFGPASAASFGSPQQPQQPSLFGGPTSFGQTPAPSMFGATAANTFGARTTFGQTTPSFGSPSTGGLFGTPQPFGAASQPAFGAASSPNFGQPATGLFGQPQQQQQQQAFGQQQTQPAGFGSSLFGATQPASSASIFGQPFGASQPAAAPFGQTGTLFGASPASSASLFGNPASSPSLFGATQQQSSAAFGSGMFGTPASQPFGASQPSMFGNTSTFKPPTSGGLFGTPTGGTSLFGSAPAFSAPAGGGLFGTTPSSGLFGPSSASLFGGGTSLFAQPASQAGGGGLFGAQTGGGLFSALAPAAAQQPAVAPPSPGQNPYGSLPAVPKLREASTGIASLPVAAGSRSVVVGPRISTRTIVPRAGRPVRRTPLESSPSLNRAARPAGALSPSPSLFQSHTRDSRLLVINSPFPSTASAVSPSPTLSPPAAAPQASPASASPPLRPLDLNADGLATTPSTFGAPPPPSAPRDTSAVVPTVPPDYYTSPPLQHLRALAAADADLLREIADFKVGKRGVAEVHYLEPVDVRGVDLGAVVQFDVGSVTVYPDEASKPEVGAGLNQRATITIWRVNEMKGKGATEEERYQARRRKLQKHCATVGARFLEYTRSGEWTFEVDHFSRWGLPDDDDEDEEEQDEDVPFTGQTGKPGAAASVVADSLESDDDEHAYEDDALQPDSLDGGLADGGDVGGGLDAVMSDADEPDVSAWPGDAELSTRHPREVADIAEDLAMAEPLVPQRPPPPEMPWPSARPQPQQRAAWLPRARPLTLSRPEALPSADAGALACQAAAKAASAARAPLDAPSTPPGTAGLLVDAGLSMGRRFRAGWSPTAQLAVPRPAPGGALSGAAAVAILQVSPGACATAGAAAAPLTALLRRRAVDLLEVHSSMSVLDGAEGDEPPDQPGDRTPDWRFVCTASALPCAAMLQSLDAISARVGESGSALAARSANFVQQLLQHDRVVWELVDRLFSHIELDAPADAPDGDRVLENAIRRRNLSDWLEQQVEAEVADALAEVPSGEDGAQQALLHLLSAHDLEGAAQLARATGYPRLATLLASAGLRTRSTAALRRQLGRDAPPGDASSWASAGYLDARPPVIPPALLCVYDLLAGHLRPCHQLLAAQARNGSGLSWLRSFGLCLWYGCEPDSSLSDAFREYQGALEAGVEADAADCEIDVACPYPRHLLDARGLNATNRSAAWKRHTDVLYELIALAAAKAPLAQGAALPEQLIGRARGCSPDPLDALLPWLLLCVLRAIGRVGGAHLAGEADSAADAVFAAVTMDVASLMLLLNEPYWAVYVALHLPARHDGVKAAAVKRIIAVAWPALSTGDSAKVELLHSRLGVPRAWTALAQAWWAAAERDSAGEVRALTAARLFRDAEERLFEVCAPAALHHDRDGGLSELVDLWHGRPPTPAVALLGGYLELLNRVRRQAAADGIMAARTLEDRCAGVALMRQIAESSTRLQLHAQRARGAALTGPVLPQQAMLARMARNVASWLLAGPADCSVALAPEVLDAAGACLPAEQRMYHGLAAAAGV